MGVRRRDLLDSRLSAIALRSERVSGGPFPPGWLPIGWGRAGATTRAATLAPFGHHPRAERRWTRPRLRRDRMRLRAARGQLASTGRAELVIRCTVARLAATHALLDATECTFARAWELSRADRSEADADGRKWSKVIHVRSSQVTGFPTASRHRAEAVFHPLSRRAPYEALVNDQVANGAYGYVASITLFRRREGC